jgi:hypothetical protein
MEGVAKLEKFLIGFTIIHEIIDGFKLADLEQVYSNYKEISIILLGSAEPNSYVLAPS